MSSDVGMRDALIEHISEALESNRPPYQLERHPLRYGTAGFRAEAPQLSYLTCRIAFLSILRAFNQNGTVGIMITASHNPLQDNGMKLIDPSGEMLDASWEALANDLASNHHYKLVAITIVDLLSRACKNLGDVFSPIPLTPQQPSPSLPASSKNVVYRNIVGDSASRVNTTEQSAQILSICKSPKILIGIDNRVSGTLLQDKICKVIAHFRVYLECVGQVTTPQLHYLVRCSNVHLFGPYGQPNLDGYRKLFGDAFIRLHSCWNELKDKE